MVQIIQQKPHLVPGIDVNSTQRQDKPDGEIVSILQGVKLGDSSTGTAYV
jgi:hypothetical protein